MAVHHHGPLNQLIRTFQEMMARDHASIINQDGDVTNFFADSLSGRVDILPFAHIASVRMDLQVVVR